MTHLTFPLKASQCRGINLSIYLSIYLCFCCSHLEHRASMKSILFLSDTLISATCCMLVSCLLYPSTQRWRQHARPKHWLTFTGLHNITCQREPFTFLFAYFRGNIQFLQMKATNRLTVDRQWKMITSLIIINFKLSPDMEFLQF
jgi:hypothetical protein